MRKILRMLKDNAVEEVNRALGDTDLLRAVQSELRHEISNDPFKASQQGRPSGSLGHFILERDEPQAQDVVMRGRYGTNEDIALSALLGPLRNYEGDSLFPRQVLMKVCIAKPGSSAVLQFDCRIFSEHEKSDFSIQNAFYHENFNSLSRSNYKGPQYSSLDPELQNGFRKFLGARGVDTALTKFLLFHLHKKEQSQYVKWLQNLESMVAESLKR